MRRPLAHHVRRTLALALPVMLARAGLVVMLTVDTVLVGRAGGAHELAYFAISTAPQLIMVTIGTGLLVSTVVLTAQADGAGRQAECGRIWRLALILGGLLGLAFGLLQWHGDLLLIDSGAQYEDGTTDVTRTIAVGEPTAEMRDRFTRVLRGVPGLNQSFAIGLIKLDAGPVLNAPLVDWGNAELQKGTRVVLAIGEIKRDACGNVFVGPRFRPA